MESKVEEEVVLSSDLALAYMPGINMAVKTNTVELPKAPSSPTQKVTGEVADNGMAKWGDDNKETSRIIDAVNSNAVLASGLYWKSNAITSGGLVYGSVFIDEKTGQTRLQRVIDPRVEEFMFRSNVNAYLREAAHEFYKFWNVWPELVVSGDRVEIASISCHESAFCRHGVQNAKGLIDQAYINANWDKDAKVTDTETIKLPVIDVYYDAIGTVRNNTKLTNFIYPLAGTSSGRTYYQRAPWMSVIDAGWLDVANGVPKIKRAVQKNQMKIKYQLEIADWWWVWKFPDFNEKKELRQGRIKDVLDDFNKKMKGEDNSGNSLMTIKQRLGDKEFSGWSITVIDEKKTTNSDIEDSQEATANILFALGLDGTLIGSLPGKGQAGSGSDKRVAMNIFIANSKAEQDIILEPISFIFRYNGYLDKQGLPYTVWFENYWITTLDKGKETQQQSS